MALRVAGAAKAAAETAEAREADFKERLAELKRRAAEPPPAPQMTVTDKLRLGLAVSLVFLVPYFLCGESESPPFNPSPPLTACGRGRPKLLMYLTHQKSLGHHDVSEL